MEAPIGIRRDARAGRFLARRTPGLLFVAVVAAACHLAFSWIGFNPSDDGFILAPCTRILRGEVPHRDFLSIRPAGSNLLHAPLVGLVRGVGLADRLLWISRGVVWAQLATIVWCWVSVVSRGMGLGLSWRTRAAWSLAAFLLSAHNFPIMAWHTIDGLFLASMGARLAVSRDSRARALGLLLAGSSPLCKQNFAPVAALAPLILLLAPARAVGPRDLSKLDPWLLAAFPSLAYVFFVWGADALPDAIVQMGTYTGAGAAGWGAYAGRGVFWCGIALGMLGGLATAGVGGRTGASTVAPFGARAGSLLVLPAFVAAWRLAAHDDANPFFRVYWVPQASGYLWGPCFFLFGTAAGAALAFGFVALARRTHSPFARVAGALLAVLLVAWCGSISIGYNTPALMAGPLAVSLLGAGAACRRGGRRSARVRAVATGALIGVAAPAFVVARMQGVYEDSAASRLSEPLAGVFHGAAGLWTNPNTSAFLADLSEALRIADGLVGRDPRDPDDPGDRVAILPDLTAFWAATERVNPLPIDWPHGGELSSNDASRVRVLEALEALEKPNGRTGAGVAIVQKVTPYTMAYGYRPLARDGYQKVVDDVRAAFPLAAETRFFEIRTVLRPGG